MKKNILIILFTLSGVLYGVNIGTALSVDFYHVPQEEISSQFQTSPTLFYSLDYSLFNLRAGFSGLTENYRIDEESGVPFFNHSHAGFYTLEFDIFISPGLLIPLGSSVGLGIAPEVGVRLPIITEVDSYATDLDKISREDADKALEWFYQDNRFLYWGANLFLYIDSPLDSSVKLYMQGQYRDFVTRETQWRIGATVGVLWLID